MLAHSEHSAEVHVARHVRGNIPAQVVSHIHVVHVAERQSRHLRCQSGITRGFKNVLVALPSLRHIVNGSLDGRGILFRPPLYLVPIKVSKQRHCLTEHSQSLLAVVIFINVLLLLIPRKSVIPDLTNIFSVRNDILNVKVLPRQLCISLPNLKYIGISGVYLVKRSVLAVLLAPFLIPVVGFFHDTYALVPTFCELILISLGILIFILVLLFWRLNTQFFVELVRGFFQIYSIIILLYELLLRVREGIDYFHVNLLSLFNTHLL